MTNAGFTKGLSIITKNGAVWYVKEDQVLRNGNRFLMVESRDGFRTHLDITADGLRFYRV